MLPNPSTTRHEVASNWANLALNRWNFGFLQSLPLSHEPRPSWCRDRHLCCATVHLGASEQQLMVCAALEAWYLDGTPSLYIEPSYTQTLKTTSTHAKAMCCLRKMASILESAICEESPAGRQPGDSTPVGATQHGCTSCSFGRQH